jgi:hypothetical protein
MTAEHLAPFFIRQPFQSLVMYLTDGRAMEVLHPDFVSLTEAGAGIWFFHIDGELEMIDPRLIVSIKTTQPADLDQFVR